MSTSIFQIRFGLGALTALGLALPAVAQAQEEEPYTGFYVGISGGVDSQGSDTPAGVLFDTDGDGDFDDRVLTATGSDAFSTGFCDGRAMGPTRGDGCENDRNRGSYYARAGYDRQFGSLVVGVVGEFGKTDIVDYVTAYSTTPASYTFDRSIDYEANLRLRAGFAVEDTLFYTTGGLGYAKIENGFSTTNGANAFAFSNEDEHELGFVVGGGLEQKITDNISFGLEYTYHDYKDDDVFVTVTQGSAGATNPFIIGGGGETVIFRPDEDFRWHSARAHVNFRF